MFGGRLIWTDGWGWICRIFFFKHLTSIKLEVLLIEAGIHEKQSFGRRVTNLILDMLNFKMPGKDFGRWV